MGFGGAACRRRIPGDNFALKSSLRIFPQEAATGPIPAGNLLPVTLKFHMKLP